MWKDPSSALDGPGDIDSMAERADWPTVVREFRAWSGQHGFGPVVLCTHRPGILIVVACEGAAPVRLLQMDVYSRHVFRGATLVTARQLGPLMQIDSRGFRRLVPGAEALLVLLRAARRGGNPPHEQTLNRYLDLLRRDREGAERLAAVVGLPLHVVRALAVGRWERRQLAAFELRAALKLMIDPRELGTCLLRDYRRMRRCELVNSLERGRRVSGNRAAWLTEIRRTHIVIEAQAEPTPSSPEP